MNAFGGLFAREKVWKRFGKSLYEYLPVISFGVDNWDEHWNCATISVCITNNGIHVSCYTHIAWCLQQCAYIALLQ